MEVFSTSRNDVWAIIDSEDAKKVESIRWGLWNGPYVRNYNIGFLHRIILDAGNSPLVTDHINRDPLNNRKKNIHLCNESQNAFNRGPPKNNKSGFKGVYWEKVKKRWRAIIEINGKEYHIGYFRTPEEAYEARLRAEKRLIA